MEIHGQGAYSALKFESGVHRVQRVPVTEASGRLQTSTATVMVMPEAEDVEIEIPDKDIKREHTLSAGRGRPERPEERDRRASDPPADRHGRHLPGPALAAPELREGDPRPEGPPVRHRDAEAAGGARQHAQGHRSAPATASEKIRTYNFPQDRLTDHRIGLTIHNLPTILGGEIQPVIDTLVSADQAEKLKQETEA